MTSFLRSKAKKHKLKKSEIEGLLKHTEGKMIGLFIRLAYFSGMRIGEINMFTWGDLDLDNKSLAIPTKMSKPGKGL